MQFITRSISKLIPSGKNSTDAIAFEARLRRQQEAELQAEWDQFQLDTAIAECLADMA